MAFYSYCRKGINAHCHFAASILGGTCRERDLLPSILRSKSNPVLDVTQVCPECFDERSSTLIFLRYPVQVVDTTFDGSPKVHTERAFDAKVIEARRGAGPVVHEWFLNQSAGLHVGENVILELFAWGIWDCTGWREAKGERYLFADAPLSLYTSVTNSHVSKP